MSLVISCRLDWDLFGYRVKKLVQNRYKIGTKSVRNRYKIGCTKKMLAFGENKSPTKASWKGSQEIRFLENSQIDNVPAQGPKKSFSISSKSRANRGAIIATTNSLDISVSSKNSMMSDENVNNVSIVDVSVATALIAPDPTIPVKSDNLNDKKSDKTKTAATAGTLTEGSKQETKSIVSIDERFYAVDPTKLQKLRDEKPWTKVESGQQQQQDPSSSSTTSSSSSGRPVAKFFDSVSLSPSAVTKIMMHCQSGVEKGVAQGGNPIEGKFLTIDTL